MKLSDVLMALRFLGGKEANEVEYLKTITISRGVMRVETYSKDENGIRFMDHELGEAATDVKIYIIDQDE
jgi:hypothetical protein